MGRTKGYRQPWDSTPEGERIYELFLKPFLKEYTLLDGEVGAKEGIEAFFNVGNRRVMFVKAKTQFTIPGPMWESLARSTRLIPGAGRRYMGIGQHAVLRIDKSMPDRNEFEFEEQVFVLTRAQLSFILEKLELIA